MNLLTDIPQPSVLWNDDYKTAFGSIHWYGIFIAIGFILSIICIMIKMAKFYKINTDPFYYFCLMAIPWSIFCGMFWSACLGERKWNDFFNFSGGGLAIQGAVVGTILLGLIWFPFILKKPKFRIRDSFGEKPVIRQVSTWVYADAIIPAILIGQVIGRWGNYINQEVYGQVVTDYNTQLWLSTHLPFMYIVSDHQYHQPLFLYESCANIVGFILLFIALEFIPKLKAGTPACSYILWYGLLRIVFETQREKQFAHDQTIVFDSLWITFGFILVVINQLGLIAKTRKYRIKLWIKDFIFTNGISYWFLKARNDSLMRKLGENDIKVIEANKKLEINRLNHENNKKNFIRNFESMLYYLNR